ncbi:uncharacterized protein LOC111709707 isoform X2 [Eurytemora carolleeae]|uniref:uncharacterized protein LOC111709707 isoform X2 n=1 Tax=Eurytemora carolleeae TaxID=1294199 RepID=UPI000C77A05A|nr:uncharacterized protein LOC111709707 isoform X2 [Eurytemora carolleeae]|eukprot:XP_023339358.1 uncharacterized protein LOC111709707 isoform X2 [Eurytemora affinis]
MFLPPVLLLVLTVSNLVLGVVETQGGHGVQTPLQEKGAQLPPREGKKGGWMDTLLSIATGRGYQQPEIEYRAVVKEKQPLPREMYITSDRRVDDLERTLEFRSPELLARSLPEQNRRVSGQPTKLGEPLKPYSSAVRPAHETELGGGLSRLIGGILPNSYYSRPQFRYPYYDTSGKGYLLYGYGGRDLYEYSVFKPLEGYF